MNNTTNNYVLPSLPKGWSITGATLTLTDWTTVSSTEDPKEERSIRVKFISNGAGYYAALKCIDGNNKPVNKYVEITPDDIKPLGEFITKFADIMTAEENLAMEETEKING